MNGAIFDHTRDKLIKNTLEGIQAAVKKSETRKNKFYGERTIWSVMADWNPAEIIGVAPSPLAADLYKELVTNRVWAEQRYEAGYKDMRGIELMHLFGGQAYIDVRASLNSFLPANLQDQICEKLINHAIEKLDRDRSLHDKVEFELIQTCTDFTIDCELTELVNSHVVSIPEALEYKQSLTLTTKNIIARVNDDINLMGIRDVEWMEVSYPRLFDREWLKSIIRLCSNEGVKTFAHLARAGFVAAKLMKSAVAANILTQKRADEFMESIDGLGNKVSSWAADVRNNKKTKEQFEQYFGHLRPGTYDINNRSYREDKKSFIEPMLMTEETGFSNLSFELNNEEEHKLTDALKQIELDLSPREFIDFIADATYGREYAKFVFTRLLSEAIDYIRFIGEEKAGIPSQQLDCIPLSYLLETSTEIWGEDEELKYIKLMTEYRYERKKISSLLYLPNVFYDVDEIFAFHKEEAQPAFITSKMAQSKVIMLKAGDILSAKEAKNCIIAIINADPGFDYLFSLGIAGLMTAYGGPNSHMAIRASEFGIPAVIGIGETFFKNLHANKQTIIDCEKRRWYQVD